MEWQPGLPLVQLEQALERLQVRLNEFDVTPELVICYPRRLEEGEQHLSAIAVGDDPHRTQNVESPIAGDWWSTTPSLLSGTKAIRTVPSAVSTTQPPSSSRTDFAKPSAQSGRLRGSEMYSYTGQDHD